MTTTTRVRVPAPRTPDHDALPPRRPRRAASSLTDPALAARALRAGTRLAADALTGVALDDPCCAARQRHLVRWTAGVLAEVRGHAGLRRPGGDDPLDAVLTLAGRLGYESEAAFSRAYKRIVGVPPTAAGAAARSRPGG